MKELTKGEFKKLKAHVDAMGKRIGFDSDDLEFDTDREVGGMYLWRMYDKGQLILLGLNRETKRTGVVEWAENLEEYVFSGFVVDDELFEWNDDDCVWYNNAEESYQEIPKRAVIR